MIVYAESSALVKRYLVERGSSEFAGLTAKAAQMGTVTLTRVEVIAAIAAAVRGNRIDTIQHQEILVQLNTDWQNLIRVVPDQVVLDLAETWAPRFSLRAYDAVHLAAAWELRQIVGEPFCLATADRPLWDAGKVLGMTVWPDLFSVIQT